MNMDALREFFQAIDNAIGELAEEIDAICSLLVHTIKYRGSERGTGRAYRTRCRTDPDALYRTIREDAGTRRAPIAADMRKSTAATGE